MGMYKKRFFQKIGGEGGILTIYLVTCIKKKLFFKEVVYTNKYTNNLKSQ